MWRLLWKKHSNPYFVWLSEIMLQQTTLAAVHPIYEAFIDRFPQLEDVAKASELEIKQAVKGLGYYRRFHFFHLAAKKITELAAWPKDFETWKDLPGIGEYTASAISSITLGEAKAAVDGNIERVLSRIFDIRLQVSQSKPSIKKLAQQLLDFKRPGDFNQAMMEVGQLFCRVKNPNCDHCPLLSFCLAYQRKSTHLAPAPKDKQVKTPLSLKVVIGYCGDKVALLKRPSDALLLKNLDGFQTLEKNQKLPVGAKKIGSFPHAITKYKIDVTVYSCCFASMKSGKFTWLMNSNIEQHLVSSLDSKAWRMFCSQRQNIITEVV